MRSHDQGTAIHPWNDENRSSIAQPNCVAAMLPEPWEKRLVDMNVRNLKDEDILWADYVFISAMIAQKESTHKVIERCKHLGVKTVGGGPLFNSYSEDFPDVDHIVLGEGESIVPKVVADIQNGTLQKLYQSTNKPCLDSTPLPLWDLIKFSDYVSMGIQYSRGCPFNCEFCDIIVMNGRVPRAKSNEQMLAELDALYIHGWRGTVFVVDDNFIGHKTKVKSLLREIIVWQNQKNRRYENDVYGVITLRDIVFKVLGKNLDLSKTKVSEIMSKPLVCIYKGMDVEHAINLMTKFNITRVFICAGRDIVGIISLLDVMSAELIKKAREGHSA